MGTSNTTTEQRRRSGCFRIQRRQRNGFSLLEVILSIAILGGSMVVIGHGFFIGYRSATRAKLRSEANMHCDSKMAELVAGVIDASGKSATPIEGFPDWYYGVEVGDSEINGLLLARVTVEFKSSDNQTTSVSVARFIPDPDYDPLEAQ